MEAVYRSANQDALALAKQKLRHEADALRQIADKLGDEFVRAIHALESCHGSVIVTGMGKAGLIGQKTSATLCSTGTPSHFLHPAEAIHGDLGRVAKSDWILAMSMSGETEELTRLLPSFRQLSAGIVSITSTRTSTLGSASDVVIALGPLSEACVNGLAPSTSTTAMVAIGDALALTISERRGFAAQDFVRFHPGGSLGRKLTKVQEIMRPVSECRVARDGQTVRDTFVTLRRPGRRTGAVMIVDEEGKLAGLFTDSDLARLLEEQSDSLLDGPVRDVMTRNPRRIAIDSLMPKAITLLAENQISELPVVDSVGRPLGMIDITDVIGWFPAEPLADQPPKLLPFPSESHNSESHNSESHNSEPGPTKTSASKSPRRDES